MHEEALKELNHEWNVKVKAVLVKQRKLVEDFLSMKTQTKKDVDSYREDYRKIQE